MKSNALLLLVLGAASAGQALAQAAAPATTPRMVTRDELRVCMNTEAEIAERRASLQARGKKNAEEADAIKAEASQLEADKKESEESTLKAASFQLRVRAHNQRVRTANEAVTVLRADIDLLTKSISAYNDKCGDIAFTAADKEAILKEREASKK